MTYGWAVIGSGFEGLYLATILAKQGQKTCLIDASKSVGGLLNGFDHGSFECDHGTQNFDLRSADIADFLDLIMPDQIDVRDWRWASTFRGKQVDQVEMLPLEDRLFGSLRQQAKEDLGSENYATKLSDKFGEDVFEAMRPSVEKFAQTDLETIAANCGILDASFGRVFFGNDPSIRDLKDNDARIDRAVGVANLAHGSGKTMVYRHGYPRIGSMRSFVRCFNEFAQRNPHLEIHTGCKVGAIETGRDDKITSISGEGFALEARQVFWSGPRVGLDRLGGVKPEPTGYLRDLATFVFEVPRNAVCQLDYLLCFDPDVVPFRIGAGGIYSGQASADDHTFVHAEVLLPHRSEVPETRVVWEGVRKSGFVRDVRHPKTSGMAVLPAAYVLPYARALMPTKPETSRLAEHIHCFPDGIVGRATRLDWLKKWVHTT